MLTDRRKGSSTERFDPCDPAVISRLLNIRQGNKMFREKQRITGTLKCTMACPKCNPIKQVTIAITEL